MHQVHRYCRVRQQRSGCTCAAAPLGGPAAALPPSCLSHPPSLCTYLGAGHAAQKLLQFLPLCEVSRLKGFVPQLTQPGAIQVWLLMGRWVGGWLGRQVDEWVGSNGQAVQGQDVAGRDDERTGGAGWAGGTPQPAPCTCPHLRQSHRGGVGSDEVQRLPAGGGGAAWVRDGRAGSRGRCQDPEHRHGCTLACTLCSSRSSSLPTRLPARPPDSVELRDARVFVGVGHRLQRVAQRLLQRLALQKGGRGEGGGRGGGSRPCPGAKQVQGSEGGPRRPASCVRQPCCTCQRLPGGGGVCNPNWSRRKQAASSARLQEVPLYEPNHVARLHRQRVGAIAGGAAALAAVAAAAGAGAAVC